MLRAGGLADYLQERHKMYFEWADFVSGLLNFQTLGAATANDLPYVVFLQLSPRPRTITSGWR